VTNVSIDPLIKAITPETNWYVVLRPFQGERESKYVRGEVVDTHGWTHKGRLVELRYVSPLPFGADVPEADEEGRRIIDLNSQQKEQVPYKKRPVPQRKPALT
jgi:hypothetical protein